MSKVLVTGAGGYIGSVASYIMLQAGYEIVGIDNFSTGYREPLELLQKKYGKEKFRFQALDLTKDNISKLLDAEKNIEAVVHFAGPCLVDESMRDPRKYFIGNVCGSLNLISATLESGIKNLVFSSTAAVYGQSKYNPIDENHPREPINPYGESKKMVEDIMMWFSKLKGLNYVILRYFNVCGASDDGLIGDSKKPSTLLIQNAVRGALNLEKFYLTYNEVETPDKSPIRDYVNVVDLSLAHLKALEYLIKGGSSEIINIGTGKGNSVLEIVETVQKVTGAKFEIKRGNLREGDPDKLIASIEKAKKVLDWEPKRTIEDSIKSLVSWYKNNPQGWKE